VTIPVERLATSTLDGMQVAQAIAAAYRFAYADPYRACTHNKVFYARLPFSAAACASVRVRACIQRLGLTLMGGVRES